MNKVLIIASENQHKVAELAAMLDLPGWEIKSLADFPDIELPAETGSTFESNARPKAETVAQATGHWALGDDSGLEVTALGGNPGVRSARYAGQHSSDNDNNIKLLADMVSVAPDRRSAKFCCVLALARPNEPTLTVAGYCPGTIASYPRGKNGFGYDPIFYLPSKKKMMAELTAEQKHNISHRGAAVRKLKTLLSQV